MNWQSSSVNPPARSRATSAAIATFEALGARLTWNHLAGYENTTVTPRQQISNYDTFDLLVGYDLTRNLSLAFDVRRR